MCSHLGQPTQIPRLLLHHRLRAHHASAGGGADLKTGSREGVRGGITVAPRITGESTVIVELSGNRVIPKRSDRIELLPTTQLLLIARICGRC